MSYGISDDIYSRLNNTKPVENRDPFFAEGETVAMVLSLEPFNHQTHGPSARATFEVISSQVHPVGSRVCKMWFLVKPSKFASQATDADRFADFVRKIKGAPEGYQVGGDCAALLRDRVAEQLTRGMVIKGFGVNTSKNPAKPFVDVRWTSVPQTQDEIRARRAKIESAPVAVPAPQAPPMQYGPPAAQAAPAPAQQGGFLAQLPPNTPGNTGTPGGGW